MTEVCVLITVYNGAPWIDEALDSALAQEEVDFEILVVDDGSTDDTPEILRARVERDPDRIRVLTIPQSGLSRARNVGFDHIDAEFTTTLDADDRMHPRRAALEVEALRRHSDAVISFAGRWNFEDGAEAGRFGFTPEAFGLDPQETFRRLDEPVAAMLEAGEYPGTDACTCRTQWARTEGRFREDFRSFVDGERWIRAVHHRAAVYVAAPLYERRVHAAAMSVASPDLVRNLFTVIDEARTRNQLDRFEKRAGIWIGRRNALAGRRWEGLKHLFRHAPRLMCGSWWRTLAFVLTPGPVHAAWRRLKPWGGAAVGGLVPLRVIRVRDPLTVWRPSPTEPRSATETSR